MNTTATAAPAPTTRWNRDERGSADRYQMRYYALTVTMMLADYLCPITGKPFDIMAGEVDRAIPALGYVPGNVVLVSSEGNQSRAALQSRGADLPGIERYVADIVAVSAGIAIPSKRDAREWWNASREASAETAALEGPYGIE